MPRSSRVLANTVSLEVAGLGAYRGKLRRAILALKDGRRDVAMAMGERLRSLLAGEAIVVPVPTSAWRRRVRGFDGSVLLARIAAAHAMRRWLRESAGDAQRGRGRGARLAAQGRFACVETALEGCEIVLLDDVMTTGSTLEDSATALRSSGAVVRRAVVVAVNE